MGGTTSACSIGSSKFFLVRLAAASLASMMGQESPYDRDYSQGYKARVSGSLVRKFDLGLLRRMWAKSCSFACLETCKGIQM